MIFKKRKMDDFININWGLRNGNWGDTINEILCEKISGKRVRKISYKNNDNSIFRYYCCGSILAWNKIENCEYWGSGFLHETTRFSVAPRKIHAVRGPLSRDLVISQNIECPEVYGDPALLYPRFYNPPIVKRYKYGIVPHYVDQRHPWLKQFKNDPTVKIINVLDHTINRMVDEVKSCDVILSSSLHGIVCGDAYGIPSYYIKLSDRVAGKGFKFRDYFLSVGRPDIDPIVPKECDHIKDFADRFHDYKISIDLDLLYEACPFKKE